jgi:hypothetical protein
MKTCSYCGHENPDDASRCDECGWTVPKVHGYARLGRHLKRAAGAIMIILVVFQFVSCLAITAKGGVGEDAIYGAVFAFYWWRLFLMAIGFGAALFWVGDFLKRNY